MTRILKKAIFPVAGLGTRFLPVTKATPKEMLPIVDKPLIQYAVEEAIAAGVTQIIFITSYSKRSIEDHFDCNYELEVKLQERGQLELLKIVQDILPSGVTCLYIRQMHPLGLGHAVLCAKSLIDDEPVAVLLADDLIQEGSHGCLREMLDVYNETQSSVLAVEHVPIEDTKKYGIVEIGKDSECLHRISHIVEKPEPEKAPSNLAVVGRYILQPSIFKALEETKPDAKGEIQLTDAISNLLQKEAIYGYYLTGKRYDCGNKLGYLQATIEYALRHPEVAEEFKVYLRDDLPKLYL